MVVNLAGRRRLAWALAAGADFLQIVAFPLFGPGFVSPLNDVLDLAVGGALLYLLGWHWALVPALLAEMVPGLDLVPTWTASVWLATRGAPAVPKPPAEEAKNVTPAPRRLEP